MNAMKAINIWVTTKCNLDCEYCYEHNIKDKLSISEKDITWLVEFVGFFSKNEPKVAVNFHGGEPLLYIDIIEEICNRLEIIRDNWILSLTTNGTLISKDNIKTIKKHSINLSVSIDGTKENHNKLRKYHNKAGSYDKCIQGIKMALSESIDIRGRMTVTPDNCEQLYENIISINSLGIKNIVAVPNLYDEEWTDNMVFKIEEDIKRLKQKRGNIDFVFLEESTCKKGICMGGKNEINITPNLDIYPCACVVGIEEFKIGNLRKKTWNNNVIMQIEKMNEEQVDDCIGCVFFSMCITSRCRLYNKVLTGFSNRASVVVCAFENMIYRINNNH